MVIIGKLSNNIKITEYENKDFSRSEEEFLINIFLTAVERLIPTLSRESWFRLDDFDNSGIYGLEHLRMLIIRKTIYYRDQWYGVIHGDKKSLKIYAVQENSQ